MRRSAKNSRGILWVAALAAAAALWGSCSTVSAAPAPRGITISPATATLTLAKGESTTNANFGITNHYAAPITVRLAFAQPVATPGAAGSVLEELNITPAEATIQPGATAHPTITLTDSAKLTPGSHQAELVLSQITPAAAAVSIIPSVRLPLAIVKLDGAVMALSASNLTAPTFAFDPPQSTTAVIANTGNIIAIPRGYISVLDPRGREVSKAVINVGSAAIAPNSHLRMSTSMTALTRAWLPGIYRLQMTYGPGSGAAAKTITTRFFFMPVWEMLLALLLSAMVYCGWQIWVEWGRLRRQRVAGPPENTQEAFTPGRGIA